MSCNQCKSEYYIRVVQYAKPLLQPLTPEQAVMDNLHEMTGKRFYRIYPSFCPMCGEKLEGSGDESLDN